MFSMMDLYVSHPVRTFIDTHNPKYTSRHATFDHNYTLRSIPTAALSSSCIYTTSRAHLQPAVSLVHRLAQRGDDVGGVLGREHGAAGDDDVGARVGRLIDGRGAEAAVDLDVELGVLFPEGLDLGQLRGHELLAAEAGHDGHDEHHLQRRASVS